MQNKESKSALIERMEQEGVDMQEVFSKIIERLEEEKKRID